MKHLIWTFGSGLLWACSAPVAVEKPAATQSESEIEQDASVTDAAILSVLHAQEDAWNRGDIDVFMQGYWRSPYLRFASGGSVTRGWQETSDGYHARYSDRAKMGTLGFSGIELVVLAPDAVIVHGQWELKREGDAPSGLFTLVFRKFGDDWRIISDTTTSAD